MKNILFPAFFILLFACNSTNEKKSNIAKIGFNKDTAVLGILSKGDTGHAGFAFISTGDEPLKIIEVSASCGCTSLKYDSVREYKKGESGTIGVDYVPKNDSGLVLKNIVVKTNTERKLKVLYIKANVQ